MTLADIVEKIDGYLWGDVSLRELSSELLEYAFPEDEAGSPSAFLVAEVLAAGIDHLEQGLPEVHAKARILSARSKVVPIMGTFGQAEPSLSSLLTWSSTKTTPGLLTTR